MTKIDFGAFPTTNDDGYISITYQGTKAEWKAIKKSGFGFAKLGGMTFYIHCTDGNI